jgi:hypothetical protein
MTVTATPSLFVAPGFLLKDVFSKVVEARVAGSAGGTSREQIFPV